jgi:hypothetical protein
VHSIYSIYDATTEDWAAILGLAHHWQFGEVKSLVVRELEKQVIPSIYKISIYHRYSVDRGLLLPSYTDLVSREETLSMEEATDLGLETSLMIMTAREVVRKGDSPTSALRVSQEELRNIIRQLFRFPEPRSDSPLSDVTAAEPPLDRRSPPLIPERSDLPTVPERENETIPFTASASLNSPLKSKTDVPASAPIISAPIPPVPAHSTQNKQGVFKLNATPNKQETKPATVSPPKEDTKPKEDPTKSTPPRKQENEPKPSVQQQLQSVIDEKAKAEAQDNKKKSLSSRLSDASKGAGTTTSAKDLSTPKEKDGEKPTDNKEAKDAKDTNPKDTLSHLATEQDPNGTPNGTPLLNMGSDQPGTPTTGQSVMIR